MMIWSLFHGLSYYEDYELQLRMNLLNVRMENVPNVSFVHGFIGLSAYYSGHELVETQRRASLKAMGARASSAFLIACKWGLYLKYDRWGWGQFTDMDPSVWNVHQEIEHRTWFAGKDQRVPRFKMPWNQQGVGLAYWVVDEQRQRFIQTGRERPRRRTMITSTVDALTNCQPHAHQLVVMGAGVGVSEIGRLFAAGGMHSPPSSSAVFRRVPFVLTSVLESFFRRSRALSSRAVVTEMSANGNLTHWIRGAAFSTLLKERQIVEHWLSLHMANGGSWALAVHPGIHFLLPLVSDLLHNAVCVLAVSSPARVLQLAGNHSLVLWEMHLLASLHACVNMHKVLLPVSSLLDARTAISSIPSFLPRPCSRDSNTFGRRGHTPMFEPRMSDVGALDSTVPVPHSVRALWTALVSGEALTWTARDIPPHGNVPPTEPIGAADVHSRLHDTFATVARVLSDAVLPHHGWSPAS